MNYSAMSLDCFHCVEVRPVNSKAEAEAFKRELKCQYGSEASACLTKVFQSSQAREEQLRKQQMSFADDWPIQMKPLS